MLFLQWFAVAFLYSLPNLCTEVMLGFVSVNVTAGIINPKTLKSSLIKVHNFCHYPESQFQQILSVVRTISRMHFFFQTDAIFLGK
jgi:hypothetical protein